MLHIVARHADSGTLAILAQSDLSSIDMHLKNRWGLTARDVMQRRTDQGSDWTNQFKNLEARSANEHTTIQLITTKQESNTKSNGDREIGDIFVDALEEQITEIFIADGPTIGEDIMASEGAGKLSSLPILQVA